LLLPPEFLDPEIRDAEHEHVVEPLACVRIDRISTAAAVATDERPVHQVGRPAVVGQPIRRLRIASASSSRSAIVATTPVWL
jgi:hypothetical protein